VATKGNKNVNTQRNSSLDKITYQIYLQHVALFHCSSGTEVLGILITINSDFILHAGRWSSKNFPYM
jgi:hypothetical protein